MGIDYLIQIMGLAIGTSAAISGLIAILSYRREQKRGKEAPTLEGRIITLTENLKSSLSVISDIEAEIQNRAKIVEKLRNDAQLYEQLRELSQSQVEAVAQTIRSEITHESKKSVLRNAIITFVIALAFFFLGFWLRGL
jgi:transcriptional regulator NrdR family protein